MKYEGPLYGKIGRKTFDTGKTSEDWDRLEAAVKAATIGTCPACQDVEPTEKALIRCRKLLRECLGHLDDRFLAASMSDLHERICAELHELPPIKTP